jgi:hypothetical protein
VWTQPCALLTSLHILRQPEGDCFLGYANHELLGDVIFIDNGIRQLAGLSQSVAEFHGWTSVQIRTCAKIHWL